MTNGKGSRRRPENAARFRRNYDHVGWGRGPDDEKGGARSWTETLADVDDLEADGRGGIVRKRGASVPSQE